MTLRRHDISGTLESPRQPGKDFVPTSLPMGHSMGAGNSMGEDGADLMFTKGTLNSSHRNLYDNLQEMKL